MIGTTISHYKILEKLGEGGMGVVYRAEDTKLGRQVALKFLGAHLLSDAKAKERFLREAQAAAALHHPNICTVHEIDEADGRTFIVMAYLAGRELSDEIEAGPIDGPRALDLAIQLAGGLAEAHSKGIVHRDIKPANLFVTSGGRGIILDFGLAQLATADSKLTREGTTLGTCAYMSPEQATGDEVDSRTDVWALGCVLYEMLAGQPPFRGHYEQAVVYLILNEEPEPLPDSVDGLAEVVRRCLAKSVDDRYHDGAELAKALRESHGAANQAQAAPAVEKQDERPSIVILPFQNRSRDEEDEYFSDGVTEDIISTLGNVEGLRVIPRGSAFHFKGKRPSLAEVVRLLKVSHVLEGTVRRAGSRLRITVELVETAEGEQVWTQRYDRVMADIFDVQDEISRAIVEALKVKLFGKVAGDPNRRGTTNVEAYNLVLKGRHLTNLYRQESVRQGLECFEEAARLDSEFASPHAYMAEALFIETAVIGTPPREWAPRVKQAALRALELDPEASEGHFALGSYFLFFEWDWAAAERELQRAIDLNPQDSAARRILAEFICWWHPSRVAEARRIAEQGVASDPLYHQGSRILSVALMVEGDHEAALKTCEAVTELSPNFHPIYYQLGTIPATHGRMQDAVAAYEKGLSLGPGDQLLEAALGAACALAGQPGRAREILKTFKEKRQASYAPASYLGYIHGALGELDRAFEWFDVALKERDATLTYVSWLKLWKGLEPLTQDPRFTRMLKTIGMET